MAETQELVFTNGTFRYGQRAIPQNRLGEIKNIQVRELDGPVYENAETDAPYTYRVFQEGGETKIRYNFPPTSDSRRTIVIDYDVTDALRYYPENGVDQLYWKAVPAGNPFPTQSSTITLHAPEPATFTNYGIYGAKAAADFQPGQRDATIKVRGPINSGQEVEVVAEWQHGVVAGQPPAWQRELDQQAAAKKAQDVFQQRWGPVFGLGFLSLAGLLIIGGPVLLYLWWYRKGRDPAVGLVADYLPEPPSDLPAGMVGTLIDESADMQDILATVLDLARRGALTIKETQEPGFLGIGTISDFVYRRNLRFSEPLRTYEDTLLDNMFKSGKEVKLSDLKNKFYTAVPTIRKQLYQAVVDEGYLAGNPETVRTTYGCLGGAALVAAIIGGFFFAAILAQYSGFAFCVPLSLAVIAIGVIILARFMPRRTKNGSEEVARWRAFKRYLQNLEKYTKVEEATEIFERYLPYAVAFGLEQSFIRKFEKVDAPPPTWWIPYGMPRPYYGGGGSARRAADTCPATPHRCRARGAQRPHLTACRAAWAVRSPA